MKRRLLLDSAIIICFFTLPWWFSGLLAFAGLVLIENFWEMVIWGLAFDIFFGIQGGGYGTFFWGTFVSIILYVVSIPIRKRITV